MAGRKGSRRIKDLPVTTNEDAERGAHCREEINLVNRRSAVAIGGGVPDLRSAR